MGRLGAKLLDQPKLKPSSDVEWKNYYYQKTIKQHKEILALRELARELYPYAIDALPPRGHQGPCGPESGCDGICMEHAHLAETLRKYRRIFTGQ